MGNVDHFKKFKIKLIIFITITIVIFITGITLVFAGEERRNYEELIQEQKTSLSGDLLEIVDLDLKNNGETLSKDTLIDILTTSTFLKCNDEKIQVATFMANNSGIIIDYKFIYNVGIMIETGDGSSEYVGYLNYYDLFKDNYTIIDKVYIDDYSFYLEGYLDNFYEIHPTKVQFYKMEEGYVIEGEDKVLSTVKNVYYEYDFEIDDTTYMSEVTLDMEKFPQLKYGLVKDINIEPKNSSYRSLEKIYDKYQKNREKLIDEYKDKYYNFGSIFRYDGIEYDVNRFVINTYAESFVGLFKIKESEIYFYNDTMLAYELVAYPINDAMIKLIPLYIAALFLIPLIYFIIISFINKLREIENKEEEKRQALTTAVAHELKTPLGIIKTHNEGLQDNIDKDKEIEYRNVINDEINHMDSLILDLLQLSKLESKRMKLKLEEIDLVQLAYNQKLKLQGLYEKKNISFEIAGLNELIVDADLKLMMLVYSNILTNAIKSVDDNGKIRIEIEQIKNVAVVKFINNGPKLTQKEINNIWDTFYMKDKSRKHELGSTGLGLAIVRAILELHNAKYGCENTEDGVCFWLKIRI